MSIQKRQERRKRRKLRRERIGKLANIVQKLDLKKIQSTEDFLHNFGTLWPYLAEALGLIKSLTRTKGDKAIDDILELGSRVSTGEASTAERSKFFVVFGKVWGGIRSALNVVALISQDEKMDNAIDDVIYIGDLINNYEPVASEDI
jgi:hypothetical protein